MALPPEVVVAPTAERKEAGEQLNWHEAMVGWGRGLTRTDGMAAPNPQRVQKELPMYFPASYP